MKVNAESFNIKHHPISSKQDKYYTLMDEQEFLDDENYPRTSNIEEAHAKAAFGKRSKHIQDQKAYFSYYIKCNPSQQAYNPIKLHTSLKDKPQNAFIDSVCKNEWAFKEVSQSIFDTYISFLKTKNIRLLKEVNRSLK